MATASQIHLTPDAAGVYHVPSIQPASYKAGSQLLQENHDRFHIFFNLEGFHNHIAHHLLTIFALGATPGELQQAFDHNANYMRLQFPINQREVEDMSDPVKFREYLGNEKYFHDFEAFFQSEIEKKGWEAVLNEYLFARDERADDLLTRMFAGFLHPIIHLGFGIEFKQPAIIVEALAQAAVHTKWVDKLLQPAEELASSGSTPSKGMVELIHETQQNEKVRNSPHWNDGNKVRDGVLARAAEEMVQLASSWRVTPGELERKTAEMINADVYFAGAAQNPAKEVRIDFFYMHCVNCSIFFSAFLNEAWLKVEDKCRLLEWKGRMDLAMYVSRGCPNLLLDEIASYQPKQPNQGWAEIIRRVDTYEDDGHAAKLTRALANGEQVCKPYERQGGDAFPIKGDMWLQLGHMVIDSVEGAKTRWVRNAGFKQGWDEIPDRAKL